MRDELATTWVAMRKIYACVIARDDEAALLRHAREMRVICESIRDRQRKRRMVKMELM